MIQCGNCESQEACSFCVICQDNLCQDCLDFTHQGLKKSDHIFSLILDEHNGICAIHHNKKTIYCANCKEIICLQCAISTGKHFQHFTARIQESVLEIAKFMNKKDQEIAINGENSSDISPKDSFVLKSGVQSETEVIYRKVVFTEIPKPEDLFNHQVLKKEFGHFVRTEEYS